MDEKLSDSEELEDEDSDEISESIYLRFKNIESINELSEFFTVFSLGRVKLRTFLLIADSIKQEDVIDEFKTIFTVTPVNDMYRIEKVIPKDETPPSIIGFLFFLNEGTTHIFFTINAKKQLNKFFYTDFLNKSRLIAPLWISQNIASDFMKIIIGKYSGIIFEFTGEYRNTNTKKSMIRPTFNRTVHYKGQDAFETFFEMTNDYGLNIEAFSAVIPNIGRFQFKRREGAMILRYGKFPDFLELAKWIIERTSTYLEEMKEFRKKTYSSDFIQRNIEITNDLAVNFNGSRLDSEILHEIISFLKKDNRIFVENEHIFEEEDEIIYRFKFADLYTNGSFLVNLTQHSAHIFQIFNANFLGVLPLIDIMDNCHPDNEIKIVDS